MNEKLKNLKIFSGIEESVVEEILLSVPERKYKAWDIIIKKWEESNWEWYIIKDWKVEVIVSDDKKVILETWDIVWEIALLNEEERTATVIAVEDTTVFVLSLDELINMINNDDNSINKEIIRRIEENLSI